MDQSIRLKSMEEKKICLLLNEEAFWRLKSRDLWLIQGDCNSKFFHKYVSYRKNINTIWENKK